MPEKPSKAIANGLAQGNLWLFNDIIPANWLYNHYPHHFFSGMASLGKRDANQLEERVKETVNDLPWAAKPLPKMSHFASTSDIFAGFGYVPQVQKSCHAMEL